jgi:hypothetical protein
MTTAQEMFQDLERRDLDLLKRLKFEPLTDLAEEVLKLSRDCSTAYRHLFKEGFVGEAVQVSMASQYWAIRYEQAIRAV